MEPLHITEFASERYFSKLRQLNSHDGTENASSSTTTAPTAPAPPPQATSQTSTFTLPLGNPRRQSNDAAPLRPSDQKKRSMGHDLTALRTQRRPSFSGSFGSLRSRVTPKRPSIDIPEETFAIEAAQQSLSLSDLFLSLPHELQEQIIAPLPIHTVLNLRLVSRSFHRLVTINETTIARYNISHTLPAYTLRLYPVPELDRINLHYVCGIWHRLHVALKLSNMIAEHTTKEIFLRKTDAQRMEFEPQHKRMRQRLIPLVFAIFHFFEKYRELHVQHLASHGAPLSLQPFTLNPIECEVMSMYDDQTLLRVHQVFPLVISSFSRRLRPPSYAGRVERSIKGYHKDRPPDEVYSTVLAIGGLRQAERFWETKGYNARRAAVDTWYGYVAHVPTEPVSKSKMSLMSHLGRKKASMAAEASNVEAAGIHDARSCNEWYCVKPTCKATRNHQSRGNGILQSSLAQGPPMSPLSPDQLRLILPDLQPLQNIWLQTAEALILNRGIVERPQDIKRNTQVLLELIRDDGTELDDDWTTGTNLVRTRSRTVNTDNHEDMGFPGGVSD